MFKYLGLFLLIMYLLQNKIENIYSFLFIFPYILLRCDDLFFFPSFSFLFVFLLLLLVFTDLPYNHARFLSYFYFFVIFRYYLFFCNIFVLYVKTLGTKLESARVLARVWKHTCTDTRVYRYMYISMYIHILRN